MPTAPVNAPAPRLPRWAWLPVPLLAGAIIAARAAGLHESHKAETLTLVLSLTFYTLVSLGTLVLIGRSFLASGTPGLLLLECGVVLWSLAGTVGDAVSRGDANVNATIFNTAILLAGLCHLAGAILTRRPQRGLRATPLWLGAGCGLALGALGLVTQAALANWLPVFFIPGQGGTPVRSCVLLAAIAMFVLSAGLLLASQRPPRSAFTSWYAFALLLLAVGLFGIMVQLSFGSVINWLGRTAQWLGGFYLLCAAVAARRESPGPLFAPATKSPPARYRYGVAIAIVLAAAALRLVFLQPLGLREAFLTFYPAVVLAALYGGLGPGLVATLLSALLADYFWIEPIGAVLIVDFANWLALGIFCTSGALISWVTETMHGARARAAVAEEATRHAAERQQAQEALRQSEERFRALADAMPQLAWIARGDGFIYWYNHGWYEYTGTTPAQMEGWGWQSVHDPKLLPQVLERWKASIATGQPFEMTFPLRRADGQFRRFLTRGHPLKDASGKVVQWFGTNTDVDELTQAEEALRRSQDRLEFALETSHTGAWDLDLDNHTAFRSLQHDRIFGYQELVPHWTYETFLEHVLPEDRAAVDAQFQHAIATQSDWNFECRIRRADGEVRWVFGAGRHRTAETGGPRLMAGIVQDITERKQAELELGRYTADLQTSNRSLQISRKAALNLMEDAQQARQQAEEASATLRSLSEQRRLALEAADLGAWDYQFPSGQVVWDERCRQMWGMAEHEQESYATVISRIHPEDRARVDKAVQAALAGHEGGSYHLEFRVVWPDGSVHWIASHGRVYFEGEGEQRQAVRFIGANMEVTAERQAQEALRESRERLATFAAASFEGIILSDRGRILDCNNQFAQMLGRTAGALKGRSIEEFVAPEDRQRVDENARAGREGVIEHQMVRRDGSRITVEAHGRPQQGHPGLRHTAIRDITERKQREQQLEKLNRTLKALKDSSQAMMRAATEGQYLEEVCRVLLEDCGHAMVWIGFTEHDEAKRIRPVASAGFEEGYLETLDLTWADTDRGRGPTGTAIRTGYPAACKNILQDPQFAPWREEALKRGYASSLVVPLLEERRDASPRRPRPAFGAITIYSRLPDAFSEDEVALLLQLAEDVSYCLRVLRLRLARVKAERRTELLAETASKLLEAESPQGVVEELCHKVLNLLDCQLFFNFLVDPSAQRLHLNAYGGIPAEEAARMEWLHYGSAVCGCAARDGSCIVVQDVQHTPDPRAELVKSHGVQAYACHPLVAGGQVLGTVSFGTRTRTRFSQEDLSLMAAVTDLVAIAMERQRAQAALQQSAQDLKRSNLDLQQFAYVASHDLQEPLRAVGGYVKLLERRLGGTLDAKGQQYVAGAFEGALRMEQLINDLLSFSRVGTRGGKFVPTHLEVPLQQALRNLHSSLQSVQAGVTHDPLPTLQVDATQLMQVFQNLIGNALKFRGEQPPQIHVGASQQNGRWVLSVRDNGIGIEPQYYERIFQLFQRLHTRKEYPGTGIGLAICKRILERHGGAIWVESQPGEGSTFFFSIPDAR
jgi:PAS domain S-box-containing protein